jgi:hypothetical protein
MRLFRSFVFSIAWAIWIAGALVATVSPNATLVAALASWFILWEALALLDSDPGDTFSEHVWAFYRERKARFYLVAGVTIDLVSLAFWAAFWQAPLVIWVGRLAVSAGLLGWLWFHFREMGRDG